MPIQVTPPLDLDSHEREIEVVADPADPTAGTARFLLREIPHGKAKALFAREASALATQSESYGDAEGIRGKLLEGKAVSTAEAERLGEALGAFTEAQHRELCELVRWGVAGHRGEDFIDRGASVPFVGASATFLGTSYTVASAADTTLYANVGRKGGLPSGPLFAALVRAIRLYQEGRVETPAEVWARAEE